MGYDATGKLTYGPNNLCLRSEDFNNAGSWAKTRVTVSSDVIAAPNGTLTADKMTEDTSVTDTHINNQAVTVSGGEAVLFSVYAKDAGRGFLSVSDGGLGVRGACFNLTTGAVTNIGGSLISASSQDAGNGWFRCTIVYRPTTTTFNARVGLRTQAGSGAPEVYTGDGTSGVYLWGAQIEAVTYQTTPSTYYPTTTAAYYGPRLVYDPVTLASQGILVEEARTNSCLQSSTFSTTWSAAQATVTANSTTAPDGTLTADTLVPTAVNNQHRLDQTTTITAAAHNASVYAKAAGYGFLWMRLGTLAGIFNLSTGAITSLSGGATGVATDVGNGWWRCALQGTTAGSDTFRLAATPTASTADYTGDGTSGIYLWGAQIELGVGASSPIPTTTAAVTRAADVAAVTGLTLAAPLTMVTGFAMALVSTATRYLSLIDAGSGSRELLNYLSGVSIRRAYVRAGGAAEADVPAGSAVTVGQQWSMASRFETNNVNLAASGTLGTADTSATMPTGLVNLHIGSSSTGTASANGTISRIRIYNTALTDAQLQAITQSLLLQEDDFSILQEDNSYIWLE
jgi:hypothetical protein